MTEPTLKCPACSSTELSPERPHHRFESHVRWKYMGKRGTFTRKDLTMGGDRARFCLSCGYLLLFAKEEDLQQLRAALKE